MSATARKAQVHPVGQGLRRLSTAAVLFHHAVAERLGLGPTDHKCVELLREHGPMIARDLGELTGLTSGAVTGIVARLESAGYVERRPDADDRRKQWLSVIPDRMEELEVIFGRIRADAAELLDGFDERQREAITIFLDRSADLIYRHTAHLRAESVLAPVAPPDAASTAPQRRRANA